MTGTAPEVLVVGAGPVGLSAAHELARQGVRVRLVDAAPGPATTSRALATHARTLETYDQMGVLDDLLPRGQRVEHFTLHQNGRRLIRFDTDYSRLPTRFPFTLMVDQVITEEVLRDAAARHGVTVEWGVRLDRFEDLGEDGVRAHLTGPDGRAETVTAGWLVGADGGHSTIRKQLGLKLEGESSETWLIADAVVDCDLPRDSIHWMRTPRGTVMMVPFPDEGKWRLLDTAETSYGGDDRMVADRFAAKIAAGTGKPARVELPGWVSVFTIQQRMIPQMRVGRVLLAGDAAHVHSPASGQGMNTGVQDAVNFSWKLAAVLRGEAKDSLLDSYGAERVPVGAELLRTTKVATLLVQLRSRKAAVFLRTAFTVLRNIPPLKGRIQRKIMGGMSALGLGYGAGPLTLRDPSARPVRPGDRLARVDAARAGGSPEWQRVLAELRRPEWLLLTHGSATEGQPRALCLSDPSVAADLGLRAGDWLLVRPDGYVAARGNAGQSPSAALASLGIRLETFTRAA
ncbi:FAD-dependent oxidoreductase [Streptomyces sp. NPDC101165]|uniref:FAD-dependent oxidoreductase n=1 Tax=Streptomyces sp. NPDC101165 TaxID=3366119 RepID=UPI003823DF4B